MNKIKNALRLARNNYADGGLPTAIDASCAPLCGADVCSPLYSAGFGASPIVRAPTNLYANKVAMAKAIGSPNIGFNQNTGQLVFQPGYCGSARFPYSESGIGGGGVDIGIGSGGTNGGIGSGGASGGIGSGGTGGGADTTGLTCYFPGYNNQQTPGRTPTNNSSANYYTPSYQSGTPGPTTPSSGGGGGTGGGYSYGDLTPLYWQAESNLESLGFSPAARDAILSQSSLSQGDAKNLFALAYGVEPTTTPAAGTGSTGSGGGTGSVTTGSGSSGAGTPGGGTVPSGNPYIPSIFDPNPAEYPRGEGLADQPAITYDPYSMDVIRPMKYDGQGNVSFADLYPLQSSPVISVAGGGTGNTGTGGGTGGGTATGVTGDVAFASPQYQQAVVDMQSQGFSPSAIAAILGKGTSGITPGYIDPNIVLSAIDNTVTPYGFAANALPTGLGDTSGALPGFGGLIPKAESIAISPTGFSQAALPSYQTTGSSFQGNLQPVQPIASISPYNFSQASVPSQQTIGSSFRGDLQFLPQPANIVPAEILSDKLPTAMLDEQGAPTFAPPVYQPTPRTGGISDLINPTDPSGPLLQGSVTSAPSGTGSAKPSVVTPQGQVAVGPEFPSIASVLSSNISNLTGKASGIVSDLASKTGNAVGNLSDSLKSYMQGLIGIESTGKLNASPSTSSAKGYFQFTNDTFLRQFYKEYGTNTGLSRQQILSLRTDPSPSAQQIVTKLATNLTEQSAAALTAAGVPISDAALYSVHFSGNARLAKLAQTNPNAPAYMSATPEQISANKSIYYNLKTGQPYTAGQVMQSFDRRINNPTSISQGQNALDKIQSGSTSAPTPPTRPTNLGAPAAPTVTGTPAQPGATATGTTPKTLSEVTPGVSINPDQTPPAPTPPAPTPPAPTPPAPTPPAPTPPAPGQTSNLPSDNGGFTPGGGGVDVSGGGGGNIDVSGGGSYIPSGGGGGYAPSIGDYVSGGGGGGVYSNPSLPGDGSQMVSVSSTIRVPVYTPVTHTIPAHMETAGQGNFAVSYMVPAKTTTSTEVSYVNKEVSSQVPMWKNSGFASQSDYQTAAASGMANANQFYAAQQAAARDFSASDFLNELFGVGSANAAGLESQLNASVEEQNAASNAAYDAAYNQAYQDAWDQSNSLEAAFNDAFSGIGDIGGGDIGGGGDIFSDIGGGWESGGTDTGGSGSSSNDFFDWGGGWESGGVDPGGGWSDWADAIFGGPSDGSWFAKGGRVANYVENTGRIARRQGSTVDRANRIAKGSGMRPHLGGGGDIIKAALKLRPAVRSRVGYGQFGQLHPVGSGFVPVEGTPAKVRLPGIGDVETRPIEPIEEVARSYMRKRGREGDFNSPFVPLNKAYSERVAKAYEDMKHDPHDPEVKRSYDALIEETMDQLRAAEPLGIKYNFIKPGAQDPYAISPALGYADIINRGRLSVFPTSSGFGVEEAGSDNPLLRRVGRIGNHRDAVANDAFRIVHDLYGHYGPGNAFFRAPGEERAFQLHSRMYSPEAMPAAASETRGQNSHVNFGPYAEFNKTASGANTHYADQKSGIMPAWARALPPEEGADVDKYIKNLGGYAQGGDVNHALRLARGGGAWTRKEGQNPNGGLNEKGRASLRAQGHDIKRPQPEGGSRRDSFCARMKGMKSKLTSAKTANDPDSRINKSLRAWNCADGGQVWDKPRPDSLGKPKHLSSEKKSKAKAMAKAAGRPYPNLVDNMRAAKADGGRAAYYDGGDIEPLMARKMEEIGDDALAYYGKGPKASALVRESSLKAGPDQSTREKLSSRMMGARPTPERRRFVEGLNDIADVAHAGSYLTPAAPYVGSADFARLMTSGDPIDAAAAAAFLPGGKIVKATGAVLASQADPTEAQAGLISNALSIAKKFVKNPVRVTRPDIYTMSPSQMADIAESRVAPESPALKRLFGVTRGEMNEIAGNRSGTAEPSLAFKKNARGAEAAQNVMTRKNTQRMIDILDEANKRPNLSTGMRPWYYMDPVYQRMEQLMGPDAAAKEYHRLNSTTGIHSPGAPVPAEINRGLGAYYFGTKGNNYGNIDDFIKYGGNPATAPGTFRTALPGLIGHPYHSTSHGLPLGKFYSTGEHGMQSPKVPLYIQSSGAPQAFQTKLPVPDAHFTRIIGMPDTRGAQTKAAYDASMSMPEFQDIGPWWSNKVAKAAGMEGVPAQALTWGAGSHLTGVDTPIGAPKLELFANHIMQRAHHHGIAPEQARDLILQGKMYKRGGAVKNALRIAKKVK